MKGRAAEKSCERELFLLRKRFVPLQELYEKLHWFAIDQKRRLYDRGRQAMQFKKFSSSHTIHFWNFRNRFWFLFRLLHQHFLVPRDQSSGPRDRTIFGPCQPRTVPRSGTTFLGGNWGGPDRGPCRTGDQKRTRRTVPKAWWTVQNRTM